MKRLLLLVCSCLSIQLNAQYAYDQSLTAYKAAQYDSAVFYIEKAITHFQSKQQTDSLAYALIHKADLYWNLKGNAAGLQAIETALKTASKLPFYHPAQVAALNKKGQILVHNQQAADGKKFLLQALQHVNPQAAPTGIYANLYTNLSWLMLELQDFPAAISYAEQAKKISTALYGPDARQLLGVYQSLLLINNDAGNYHQAEVYGQELLRLAELNLPNNHPSKGLAHNDMGILYETMHRYDEALFHKQEMVRIIQQDYAKHKNPQLLAIAYNNMGSFYQALGEVQLSLDYYDKAKKLHEINYGAESAGIVRPLTHLANLKTAVGAFQEADSLYQRAYLLQQQIAGDDFINLAYVETQHGDLYFQQKQYDRAEKLYDKALLNYKKANISNTGILLETRTTLAEVYSHSGRLNLALPILKDVLRQYRGSYPAGNIVLAGMYNKISKAYLLAKQPEKALLYSDSIFLELLQLPALPKEDWIKLLPYNQHIIHYLQNRTAIEKAMYQLQGGETHLKQILQLATDYSSYLSRSLPALRTQTSIMQVAGMHKAIYNSAIDACWELHKKTGEASYLEKAFEFAERSKALLLRLSANNLLADAARATNNKEAGRDLYWRKRISSLNAQYLDADRKNDSLLTLLTGAMEGYRLFQDSLLKLGSASVKLKYELNPAGIPAVRAHLRKMDQTLLQYVVTDEHVYIFALNNKRFHVHRLPASITKEVEALKELYNLSANDFKGPAYRLYKQLIQPVEKDINTQNLLVVPDGELFYLNLELLISDAGAKSFSTMPFLLNRYTISYELSATNALLMQSAKPQERDKALLLAPVFTDEMKKAYRQTVPDSADADPYYFSLLRQPFTLMAARQISKHVKHDLFTGQDALESVIKKTAGNYSILHLGTHAEVNHSSPLLSRFFMAKPIPFDSTGKDDGYLHAYEIYGIPLKADLAVLTACETGIGNWAGGEGVLSLAHSFMYAGCPSVVMSLWKIDEKSSAEIITGFYKNLSDGQSRSDALRNAKLDQLKQSTTLSHPYYWAGMTLVGDTTAVYPTNNWWWWLIIGILLSALLFWWLQKKS